MTMTKIPGRITIDTYPNMSFTVEIKWAEYADGHASDAGSTGMAYTNADDLLRGLRELLTPEMTIGIVGQVSPVDGSVWDGKNWVPGGTSPRERHVPKAAPDGWLHGKPSDVDAYHKVVDEKTGFHGFVPVMSPEYELMRQCCGATLDADGNPGRHRTSEERDADADGWIPWHGVGLPSVSKHEKVLARLANGAILGPRLPDGFYWHHVQTETDIIAYKLTGADL